MTSPTARAGASLCAFVVLFSAGCVGMQSDQDGGAMGGVTRLDPSIDDLIPAGTGQKTANCGFSDDGTVRYMTTDMFLCRIRLTTRGLDL